MWGRRKNGGTVSCRSFHAATCYSYLPHIGSPLASLIASDGYYWLPLDVFLLWYLICFVRFLPKVRKAGIKFCFPPTRADRDHRGALCYEHALLTLLPIGSN